MGRTSFRTSACLVMALFLIMTLISVAGGADKCQAALDAKNNAWKAYQQADKAFLDSLGPLIKAMGDLDKADGAFTAAQKAADASVAQNETATQQWIACLDSGVGKDCSAQARAMKAASRQLDAAVLAAANAFADFLQAGNAVKAAKEKQHAAYLKLKQARDAYEAASAAYVQCQISRV